MSETWTVKYGYIRVHRLQWYDGNDLVFGGYATHHARDGSIEKTTPVQENVRITNARGVPGFPQS
jgi:hypothetical protein